MEALLEVRGVGKRFGAYQALVDVNFDVREHEILGLIGPTGPARPP